MALFHVATLTPGKAELIANWVPTQPWGPDPETGIETIGAFRFDDPAGQVGMETHLVRAGDKVLHVPLTYRDEPLAGAEDAFVVQMHHSALGTRWVYDGLRDPQFVMMLAAVTMTGQGEALGLFEKDGRWQIAPATVRIQSGGWTGGRVPIDGLELAEQNDTQLVFRNDRFELTVFRHPSPGRRPHMGLTSTWEEQPIPLVLAEVREHTR